MGMEAAGRIERRKAALQFDCEKFWGRFRLLALDVSHEI